MLRRLIDLNSDLKSLWDDGYEMELRNSHLLIHNVPYLNAAKKVVFGILVSTLDLNGDLTNPPRDHVTRFIGEYAPCDQEGRELEAIIIGKNQETWGPDLVTNFTFSSKPSDGTNFVDYQDYYQKITTYYNILSAPARFHDETILERTSRVIETNGGDDIPFKYLDTNTTSSQIGAVAAKLHNQKIAIVGAGGTGSYILDLVAKSPVAEIHPFDGDKLKSNNAFRMPGAASVEELRERPYKTDYLVNIYSKMRKGIVSHPYYIDENNIDELNIFDYVFVSVDKGEARRLISSHLLEKGIPFIDVGMGLHNVEERIIGTIRVTSATKGNSQHLPSRLPCESAIDNDYLANIQIADLNALNAALAVIKWKKMCEFYHDFDREHHSTYTVEINLLRSEEREA